MIKTIPPSPALSQAEMPVHGLPNSHMNDYYLQHHQASTAYYPQEQQVSMESIHPRSQPTTRYSTPVLPRSIYHPTNQQVMQPYPQYNYPQPPQYDHSPYAFTDEYGTASSQPYSTPATSPPTPSRSADVRVTRNGAYPRGGKAIATSRPPPPSSLSIPATKKKAAKDRPKAVKKSPHLSGPMSEITKDSQIPVVDIATYVHRSAEERVREVTEGKVPGKIKRPMNAFMLYRKAYQNRAKEWCSQHNHQVVSQVCGDSWPLEPEHVRAQFTEWAKLERDNHQKAHPSYKFTPSKPHKINKPPAPPSRGGKRGIADDDDVQDDDPNDPDWRGSSKRIRRTDTPSAAVIEEDFHRPRSVYGGGGGEYQQQHHNRSAFHATNPGKPVPQPYDTHAGAGGHYYQTMQVRDGAVEHIMYKKTPSPAAMMHHHQHHHHSGGGYDQQQQQMGGYGHPPQMQMQMQYQGQHHGGQQYIDTQHLQQHHHQHQQQSPPPAYHHLSPQRVDPSLLPSGTAGDELLDIGGGGGYGHYPHQLDPAHPGQWNEGAAGPPGQQQVYLDHETLSSSFEFGQYGGIPGDEFADPTALLAHPEQQEKIFNQEPWQVLDSSSLAVEGDDWDSFGDLQLQTPATAGGQLEELDRK